MNNILHANKMSVLRFIFRTTVCQITLAFIARLLKMLIKVTFHFWIAQVSRQFHNGILVLHSYKIIFWNEWISEWQRKYNSRQISYYMSLWCSGGINTYHHLYSQLNKQLVSSNITRTHASVRWESGTPTVEWWASSKAKTDLQQSSYHFASWKQLPVKWTTTSQFITSWAEYYQ